MSTSSAARLLTMDTSTPRPKFRFVPPINHTSNPPEEATVAVEWSLIEELEKNRNSYRAEAGGTSLKITLPYKQRIIALCERVSKGPHGKRPGMQPACAALIVHSIDIWRGHPEVQERIAALQGVSALPEDIDGAIQTEIDQYGSKVRLPPLPESTESQNVILPEKEGTALCTLAGELEIDHHKLAVLCLLESLASQPGINLDHKEAMLAHLYKVRKQFRTTAWMLDAVLSKLNNPPKGWNGRRA
jgi:hypothetical protein